MRTLAALTLGAVALAVLSPVGGAEGARTSSPAPPRHDAGSSDNRDVPPMGARFRLRAGCRLPASRRTPDGWCGPAWR
jgi:hypothetical protein